MDPQIQQESQAPLCSNQGDQRANTHLVEWEPEAETAFKTLKKAPVQAPVLSLPTGQNFPLYITEKAGTALGVLTQTCGTTPQPVAYLSKEIDVVTKGWPHCLWVVVAVAILVSEAVKIIQGKDLIEAFPCKTEKAQEVIKVLIHEIIPRFGLPQSLQSNNGLAFKATITQGISRVLGIQYHLHCAWRPQSSGKVKKANETLKRHLKETNTRNSSPTAYSFAHGLVENPKFSSQNEARSI
nr:uncharacterized protein LOC129492701 [Symphalangus syndactylus]